MYQLMSSACYNHQIGVNTWKRKNRPRPPANAIKLLHHAILYPTRKDLAVIYKRLLDAGYPLTGAADHGVSEALYLDDPDVNGVELYWDRPREQWPVKSDGSIEMYTVALDLEGLLGEVG